MQTAKNVSSDYDSIIDMFQRLENFLHRLRVHLYHDITPPVREIVVEILAQLLLIIGLATKLMKEGRVGETVKLTPPHPCSLMHFSFRTLLQRSDWQKYRCSGCHCETGTVIIAGEPYGYNCNTFSIQQDIGETGSNDEM
jgi:hypothetical protein